MKLKQLLLFSGILALLFYSCESPSSPRRPVYEGQGGGRENGKFYAQDIAKGVFYSLYAEMLHENEKCKVWAEKGSGMTIDDAKEVAKAYLSIYEKMLPVCGFTENSLNTMDIADYYGNEDKKLCILLLKIRDGYTPASGSYVAGYFSALDFFGYNPADYYTWFSNESDMIYINVNVAEHKPGEENLNRTLAHEMQHLMNFVTTLEKRSTMNSNNQIIQLNQMDIWIDEGLSAAAEWVYANPAGTLYGKHSENRVNWYKNNGIGSGSQIKGLIDRGNNFFVWGNREDQNPYAVQDDYATVYLFFQWLRLQANSTDIYNKIITSSSFDYGAVTIAANTYMPGNGYTSWETLLKTWLAANHIMASTGKYGYMNDIMLRQINTHSAPSGTTSISLAPGEGVYSKTNSQPVLSGQGSSIRNTYLNKSNSQVNDSSFYSGGAMLTFNANTNTKGFPETGKTTGTANIDIVPASLIMQTPTQPSLSGPYQISAGDMLRRNGHGDIFRFPRCGLLQNRRVIAENE